MKACHLFTKLNSERSLFDRLFRWWRNIACLRKPSRQARSQDSAQGPNMTKLTHVEEQFRLVVESAPCGMLIVDADGMITVVNRQVETLLGYEKSELIGQ